MKGTRLAGTTLALAMVLALSGAGWAATLDDLQLGDSWMGETWDKESLRGRTVVIEFWGYN